MPCVWVVECNPEGDHGLYSRLAPDHAALLASTSDHTFVGAFDGGAGDGVACLSVAWIVHHAPVALDVTGEVVDRFALANCSATVTVGRQVNEEFVVSRTVSLVFHGADGHF